MRFGRRQRRRRWRRSGEGQIGQQGQQMSSNVGEAIGSGAAARASGYVGTANALTGGLNTYLNYSNSQNIANALAGNNPAYARGMP